MNQNTIDTFYIYLNSQQTTQEYLYKCYQKIGEKDAESKSYQNCNAFLYYLQHGKKFYENGQKLDMALQPVLLFYGMSHLLKAVLLTKRPDYPESTTMMAHGVSSRKRKKKQYKFIDDEVKIQHKGLFPYMSEHLFHIKGFPFEKISMKRLFSLIPELVSLFSFHEEVYLIKIGKLETTYLSFPETILDSYHLTKNSFVNRLTPYLPNIVNISSENQKITFQLANSFIKQERGPFFIHMDQTIYFPIERDGFLPISEIMVHYLLLYNLSMVSRYEAEWWGDLLVNKSEIDYPLITQFLNVTAKKAPFMLGEMLNHNF